jgi:hypothetical protein
VIAGKGPDLSGRGRNTGDIGSGEINDYDGSHEICGGKVLGSVEKHINDGIASGGGKSRFERANGVNAVTELARCFRPKGILHGYEGEKSKEDITDVSNK